MEVYKPWVLSLEKNCFSNYSAFYVPSLFYLKSSCLKKNTAENMITV